VTAAEPGTDGEIPASSKALAAIFGMSGTLHLVCPRLFEAIVPRGLPWRRGLVYFSGVSELICAVGLARGDRWAGSASAILLAVVFPANVQFALDKLSARPREPALAFLAVARLPLQWPMIRAALAHRRALPPGTP